MSRVSYAECLPVADRANWRISDILGDHQFDVTRRWLPAPLSGADGIACLTRTEELKLSHVELGAYAHVLGCLEEFMAPTMMRLARNVELEDRAGFEALASVATDDIKHVGLFREIRARVNAALGFPLALLPEVGRVTSVVLSKHIGAVLLLTASISLLSEQHYLMCFQEDVTLDPLTRKIFKAYWRETSQHARLEHLETLRMFQAMTAPERDDAINDFVELMLGMEGLLQVQARFDVQNLLRYIRRPLANLEQAEILAAVLTAKRYTFIESGLLHPSFRELFSMVATRTQRQRVEEALGATLATVPEAESRG
jgi:hypothetical protein